MGLIRIIILGLAIWLIWRMWQIHKRKAAAARQDKKPISGGRMVKCAHCGTHLPEQTALPLDELWFCSKAHREQHEQDQKD